MNTNIVNISPDIISNLDGLISVCFTLYRKYLEESDIIRFVLNSGDEIKFFFNEDDSFTGVYYRLKKDGEWLAFNAISLGDSISDVQKNSLAIVRGDI